MGEELKAKILAAVRDDLAQIEARLAENLVPQEKLVRDVAGHVVFGQGKRFRPLLMVLAARICGAGGEAVIDLATVFEYLHAASLLHDDLIDEAALRRGKPAAHLVFGREIAVLTGDYLMARALKIAARPGRIRIIEVIAGITEEMSQGEIVQRDRIGDIALSEADYTDIIRRKTAVLFQGACRTGAILAGASEKDEKALDAYGYHLGLAFQMADDLLDYTRSAAILGKREGADLREGKLTLPLIYVLENSSPAERQWIGEMVAASDFSPAEFGRLVTFIGENGGIDYTRRSAEQEIEKAVAALTGFHSGQSLEVLGWIAQYALVRGH